MVAGTPALTRPILPKGLMVGEKTGMSAVIFSINFEFPGFCVYLSHSCPFPQAPPVFDSLQRMED